MLCQVNPVNILTHLRLDVIFSFHLLLRLTSGHFPFLHHRLRTFCVRISVSANRDTCPAHLILDIIYYVCFFVVYFTTFFCDRLCSVEWGGDKWMMNWKRVGRKRSSPNFKALSQHLPGGNEGNHEKLSQDSRSPGPDLNPELPKYEGVLTCEISSSHGGEYDVQNCLLGCTAV
jgi:hypothetical protein